MPVLLQINIHLSEEYSQQKRDNHTLFICPAVVAVPPKNYRQSSAYFVPQKIASLLLFNLSLTFQMLLIFYEIEEFEISPQEISD